MAKADWTSFIVLQFKHYACQSLKWSLFTKYDSV